MFTFMQWLSRYWGKLYSEGQDGKALEKKSIEMSLRFITIKTHGLAKELKAYCNKRGETPPWNVGDRSQCISGLLKVSPAQTVETIAKWFDLPPQFYRKSKAVGTRFRLCSIFNSRNRKAGSRKTIRR